MKTIDTLIKDVEEILASGIEWEAEDAGLGERLSEVLRRGLRPRDTERGARPWFSNIGSPCLRQLWYKVHCPDEAEPIRANTKFKFMYGDIIEEVFLELARAAGHTVSHEQERMEWNGLTGRIDAVIDGHLVDVKSASSYSFEKFRGGLRAEDDSFGYLGQLKGYLLAARASGLVEPDCNTASFVVIDKTLGSICLDTHRFKAKELLEFEVMVNDRLVVLDDAHFTPSRAFSDEPDGKSGNRKLGTNCSYCAFREKCWPGVQTYLYAGRPRFLTKVVREPNVPKL